MPRGLRSPNILGVYLGHDLGACLLRDGQIAVMIEEERLNRFKHGRPNSVAGLWSQFAGKFGYFPWAAVCYCLEATGIGIDDLDLIVLGDHLWAASAVDTIHTILPIKDRRKVIFVTEPRGAVHHFHHALSAFMASPFEQAAVLVVDGDGNSNESGYEAESGYLFEGRDGRYQDIFKNRYTDQKVPRSGIGWTYEQVTYLLGFSNPAIFLAEPGKTMGLAAYGQSRPEFDEPWIRGDGFKLDFSGFHRWLKETGYDSRILAHKGGLATGQGETSQYAKDIAYKAQAELEGAMLHLADQLHRQTGARNLCLAGGVALNSVANGLLSQRGPFEKVFIQPASHDGGQAIGLAYHGHLLLTARGQRVFYSGMKPPEHAAEHFSGQIKPIPHAFGGRHYKMDEILRLLEVSGLPFQEMTDATMLTEDAAAALSSFEVVGWFQGGSEYGPRALGHRSILANPSPPTMKDQLNKRVKFRESFRPFAPSVLQERGRGIFDLADDSPYMLLVARVNEAWKARIPAVIHVDGTARIQTVDRRVDPLFHRLISEFERRTSIPLVLNTSFNLRGMPIVESPLDALHCFLSTDMDCLYLERAKVARPDPSLLFPLLSPGWQIAVEHDIDANRVTVMCAHPRKPGTLRLNTQAEFARMLNRMDGTRSLTDVFQSGFRERDEWANQPLGINDVMLQIQDLIRRGVLQLRVGGLVLGEPQEDAHWWQAP
jgi:carbamoyltransferase